jgi:hypothetical protein
MVPGKRAQFQGRWCLQSAATPPSGVNPRHRDQAAAPRSAEAAAASGARHPPLPIGQCMQVEVCSAEDAQTIIRKCIVTGFFSNAAQLVLIDLHTCLLTVLQTSTGFYKNIRGGQDLVGGQHRLLHLPQSIHPSSVLYRGAPRWVVFHEVVETTQIFMRVSQPCV